MFTTAMGAATIAMQRFNRLAVFDFSAATALECMAFLERHMRFQCLIQDGELQLMRDNECFALTPVKLKPASQR